MKAFRSVLVTMVTLLAGAAAAVQPATWAQNTQAEFAKGELDGAVVTSYGEIRSARRIQVLIDPDDAPEVIAAIAPAGDVLYVASGSDNQIFRLAGGVHEKFAELPSTLVTALLWTGRDLIAAGSGEQAGLYRIDAEGNVQALWTDPDVRYVWDILRAGRGGFYAATGPKAAIYRVRSNGQAEILYELPTLANNILALAADANGTLYAGTDKAGLVLEIDPARRSGRVIFHAQEKEISALVVDPRGGVYAATADVARMSGAPDPPAAEAAGRAVRPEGRGAPAAAPQASAAASSPDEAKADDTENQDDDADAAAPASTEATPATPPAPAAPRAASGVVRASSNSGSGGNAVYYIAPSGVVSEIFRQNVAILSLALSGEQLLLGTGDKGQIFSVRMDGDEIGILVDTEASQITTMATGRDGTIYFGTANKGSVGRIDAGHTPQAVYLSEVLDATQIAHWGAMQILATTPEGTRVTVATRSGNVKEPDETTWSEWSQDATPNPRAVRVASPTARFLQYRLTLHASEDGDAAPTVRQVQTVYQVANLAPRLQGVTIEPRATATGRPAENAGVLPMPFRQVQISASDANKDDLLFEIQLRQVGRRAWVTIASEHDKPQFVWDTRTVADGEYELRVIACDRASNPPGTDLQGARISDPFVIDNTRPEVQELTAGANGNTVEVKGVAVDALSRIRSIAYSLNSNETWVPILPTDGICDSSSEPFEVRIEDVARGHHRLAIRVVDELGNMGFATAYVDVE